MRWSWLPEVVTCYVSVLALLEMPFDCGYEFILTCDLSDASILKGHNEQDKDGFACFIKAIQGTVWSSAIMANSKQRELKASYTETTTSVVDNKKEHNQEGNALGQDDDQSNQCNTYEPPNFSQSGPLEASIGAELEADKA